MVRAKFKVTRISSSMSSRSVRDASGQPVQKDGRWQYEQVEMRTIVLHPVCSDDPNSENKKFWDASPSGQLELGTINPDAWCQFELDKEYYLDFTPA